MKKLVLAILVLCCATAVVAKEVIFKFDVFSSGPRMYACNAGLAHKVTQTKYCHVPGSETDAKPFGDYCLPCVGQACGDINLSLYFNYDSTKKKFIINGTEVSPTDATKIVQSNNCACTAYDQGNYLRDYVRFKYLQDANTYTVEASNPTSIDPLTTSNFNTTQNFMNNITSGFSVWGTSTNSSTPITPATITGRALESVTFNLGSERYGAEYFIDVCYMGSQIEYWADSVTATNMFNYSISTTDLTPGGDRKSYVSLASPYVKVYINCDLQGAGTHKCAGDKSGTGTTKSDCQTNPGSYDQVPSVSNWIDAGDIDFAPSIAGKTFSKTPSSGVSNLNYSGSMWINGPATTPKSELETQSPRFCIIRYYIKETNNMFERKWQRHDANFCTNTSIEEPVL
ncbi:MAG: hypothetical protein HQK51_19920 [Oligoflexia bacterium]|nr:hypothetical protein [Oligoflexia bacterium]